MIHGPNNAVRLLFLRFLSVSATVQSENMNRLKKKKENHWNNKPLFHYNNAPIKIYCNLHKMDIKVESITVDGQKLIKNYEQWK